MATPVTLDEIYQNIIANLGGQAPTDTTLNALLQGLGAAMTGAITPSAYNFPNLHRALANIQSGVAGDRKIGLVGDSTTWGFHDLPGIGSSHALAQLLTSAGYPAALGMSIPKYSASLVNDTRWSAGTGWTQPAGTFSFAGVSPIYVGAAGAAAASLTFTPSLGYSYDTFDVWYLQTAGAGGMSIAIDGGSPTVVPTNGASLVTKATITGSAATNHVLDIGSITTGSVFIVGVEPSLSTTPKFRVGNVGVSGATTTGWTNTFQGQLGPLAALAAYAADVWIIMLGINDAGTTNLSTNAYLANLLTIINTCKASGDVIVMSTVPSQSTGTYLTDETGYAAALPAFCALNGVGFVDIFNRWGGVNGYNELQPLGYYYDSFHPSGTIGYPDIARAEFAKLTSA